MFTLSTTTFMVTLFCFLVLPKVPTLNIWRGRTDVIKEYYIWTIHGFTAHRKGYRGFPTLVASRFEYWYDLMLSGLKPDLNSSSEYDGHFKFADPRTIWETPTFDHVRGGGIKVLNKESNHERPHQTADRAWCDGWGGEEVPLMYKL